MAVAVPGVSATGAVGLNLEESRDANDLSPIGQAAEIDGDVSVISGPGILGLTLAHLRDTVGVLTSRGEYPPELDFAY